MAEVIRKEQCPECAAEGGDTKGDNLAIFDNDKRYCYAGHGYVGSNREEQEPEIPALKAGMETGYYISLDNRGIRNS